MPVVAATQAPRELVGVDVEVTITLVSRTEPQWISTFIPEYLRPVAAFLGIASGAFALAVPQGGT